MMYSLRKFNQWKAYMCLVCMFLIGVSGKASDEWSSPNGKIVVSATPSVDGFKVSYKKGNETIPVVHINNVGLCFSQADAEFVYMDSSPVVSLKEDYTMVTGKRRHCMNQGNQQVFHFKNAQNVRLDLEFRVYDDGIAFRYVFPELKEEMSIAGEKTTFQFQDGITRWTQKLSQSYEDFYLKNKGRVADYSKNQWGFPALFEVSDAVFSLLSEANIMRGNCGSWLNNVAGESAYQVEMSQPTKVSGRWCSPWRVAIIGSLADVVESTLITDVSEPCRLTDVSWIKPGVVSWIYWAYNHGSNDYQIVKKYIDFAADFHLPYMLIDAEWDEMANGGNVEDALRYAKEKHVSPLLWYNSSTEWCLYGPLYRLNKPEVRQKEFAWLESAGVKGIKVDFFTRDSVSVMNYFIDILEDAAKYHLMVNFHGATIPRGWQRTYPHMMSVEAVYGAEWYNNKEVLTDSAAWHNCTLPFTRNVIGPMDYTPCTFTDSQHPHITSNGHELALLVVFESALQHLADRPEGYHAQPAEVRSFISSLPTVWEDTKLLDGYPSHHVVMARKNGDCWYIGGLNGTNESMPLIVDLGFIHEKIKGVTLYADGQKSNQFAIRNLSGTEKSVKVDCLPRGGFVMTVEVEP
ncbi:glycoside hydrolase family 97 protein [uncultured Bacteroides sp.]|uniref:glycoside hydrolase family 97 protein n=1 Tax=uncultured Bacteroides sp. TaxID=162156 RepID=UPI00280BC4A0|nr:glycoside hydrolase family 97 protein [uncultured Bacteroides sp.]